MSFRRQPAGGAVITRIISHRELRNNSSQILRDVENGETIIVTNNRRPAARLVPPSSGEELRLVQHRDRSVRMAGIVRKRAAEPIATVIDDLRDGDR
jgi:prevent-host-death family protein